MRGRQRAIFGRLEIGSCFVVASSRADLPHEYTPHKDFPHKSGEIKAGYKRGSPTARVIGSELAAALQYFSRERAPILVICVTIALLV
jgi:hypothetical protein